MALLSSPIARRFHDEVLRGSVSGARRLIQEYGPDRCQSRYAVPAAASTGDVKMVEFVVEHANGDVEYFRDGRTGLMEASHRGHLAAVKYLVQEAKASVDATPRFNPWPWTAFMYACVSGHVKVARFLAHEGKANVHYSLPGYQTVLLFTIMYRTNASMVRFLVEECGMNVNATDEGGISVLMFACELASEDVLRYILEECKVDIDYCTPYGNNALTWAVLRGQVWCLQLLVKHGARIDTFSSANFAGRTAIQYAQRCKPGPMVVYLQREALYALLLHGTKDKSQQTMFRHRLFDCNIFRVVWSLLK